SPSRPKATTVTSMSPSAKARAMTSGCESVSLASKSSSTTSLPASDRRLAAAVRRSVGRAASTMRNGRREAYCSAIASAMSDVPPSSSRDWGLPTASITVVLPFEWWVLQAEPAGLVGHEHAVRVHGVADLAPLLEPRIHLGERLRRQAGVLGQIEPATHAQHPLVQLGAPPVQPVLDREVDGDRPARHRERQRRSVALAEAFEHVEERHVAGLGDGPHDRAQLVLLAERHDELVLQEAVRAVGAVPLPEQIQRVVELRQVLDQAAPALRGLAVVQLTDRAERQLVGQPGREDVRQCEQLWRVELQ